MDHFLGSVIIYPLIAVLLFLFHWAIRVIKYLNLILTVRCR